MGSGDRHGRMQVEDELELSNNERDMDFESKLKETMEKNPEVEN